MSVSARCNGGGEQCWCTLTRPELTSESGGFLMRDGEGNVVKDYKGRLLCECDHPVSWHPPGSASTQTQVTARVVEVKYRSSTTNLTVDSCGEVDLEDFKDDVATSFQDLKKMSFYLQEGKTGPKLETTEALRSYLNRRGSELFAVSRCQAFSRCSEDHAMSYAAVSAFLMDDAAFEDCEDIDEIIIDHVYEEMCLRIRRINQVDAGESTMREFIGPLLLGALEVCNIDLIRFSAERRITGMLGTGPVDYDFLYKMFHVCVAEAKKEDIEKGVVQNVCQLMAGRDDYEAFITGNKRKRSEAPSDFLKDLPSFGIVSSGAEWAFTKYYWDNEWRLVRSSNITVPLHRSTEIQRQDLKESIARVIRKIVQLLRQQVYMVNSFYNSKVQKTESSTSSGLKHA